MAALGGLIRGMVFVLLFVLMGMLVFMAVRSLAADPAPPPVTSERAPAAPTTAAPDLDGTPTGPTTTVLLGDPQSAASVACFRVAAEAGSPFYVEVIDPGGASEHLAVRVVLVGPDGTRHERTVELGATGPNQPVQAAVDDSGDPSLFVDCVVTAVQRDRQVILTGN